MGVVLIQACIAVLVSSSFSMQTKYHCCLNSLFLVILLLMFLDIIF